MFYDNPDKFKGYFGMSRDTYNFILGKIHDNFKRTSNFRQCIESGYKLTIILR